MCSIWRVAALLIFIVLVACQGADAPPADDRAVCLQGESFVADGDLTIGATAVRTAGAHAISDFRWEPHEGCERFVIDLAAADGGTANSPGEVRAELLRDLGVVRVSLLEVEQVNADATDAAFDGQMARAAYAVWAPEGRWTYVDLHLHGEAEAHVHAVESPARVVVDLRPGGGALPPPPATSQRVVVLTPRRGDAAYPLEVVGYARTFEANVVVRLEQNGEQVHQDFTTATAWVDAWGHFTFTIPSGPLGRLVLHVGEHSARDGSWEGVAIELNMR